MKLSKKGITESYLLPSSGKMLPTFIAFTFISVSGCSTQIHKSQIYRSYSGNPLPAEKVCVLLTDETTAQITNIDGKSIGPLQKREYEFLPGDHSIGVRYSDSKNTTGVQSDRSESLSFTCEADYLYTLLTRVHWDEESGRKTWKPRIRKGGFIERADL